MKAAPAKVARSAKKPRKAGSGQKEMLMSIEGNKAARRRWRRPVARPQRKSAYRLRGIAAGLRTARTEF